MNPDTLTGRRFGPYEIVAPIGAGGMAHVYRAVHTQLNRRVAIKILRRDLALGAEFPDRFRREARAVAGLRHPHIVQVFDFDSTGPQPYIVMELLEGGSVRDLLNEAAARGDRLSLDETARIVADALEGLAHAHAAGIIHRDLKPGNLLLSRDGRAVLTDFGIAVVPDDAAHTATGALMGTLAYMAPEQGLKGTAGVASDVYAMGVILYELATGRVPFEGDTPLGTLMKHVNEPLPDPRSLNPELPEPVAAVIERALAKDPANRFPSADAMRTALLDALRASGQAVAGHVVVPQALSAAVVSGGDRQAWFGSSDAEAPTEAPQTRAHATRDRAPRTGMAVFVGLAVLFFGNLLGIGAAGMLGRAEHVLLAGWPFEVLWVAFFLALLGRALRTTAFYIPVGLVLAVGLLCAYFASTGSWGAWWWWLFAIALTPSFIVGCYAVTRRDPTRWRSRVNTFLVVLTGACAAAAILAAFRLP